MFIVLLKFSENKSQASEYMKGHNEWIQQGFADQLFLMVGSIEPAQGGYLLVQDMPIDQLNAQLQLDPFIKEKVVEAEILELTPKMADERLKFLIS